ncbi:cytochrome P450 [Lactarius akahatsu]|uniref:Cytochrome P450 n=1 Tax=Lactarius akahatsu TaxID=416441 RepID=A0AAD4LEY1_9AGAM|nr:cytochrome P450 [Lactarius akahatsu]
MIMVFDNISTSSAGVLVILVLLLISSRRYRLPPGPPGNVAVEFTESPMPVLFDKWRKQYGPIFSFKIGTKLAIVLNNIKATSDLLDKKGDIYSSRPRLVVAHDILSGGKRGLSAPYGDHWRRWRKLQHMGMNERAAVYYREQQTLEAAIVLRDLLADGGNSHDEILWRFVTSVVLGVSYGCHWLQIRILMSYGKSDANHHRRTVPGQCRSLNIDRSLLYYHHQRPRKWPSLLWLPKPLQWFRPALTMFEEIRANDTETYLDFFNGVKRRFEAGIAKECMGTYSLSKGGNQGMTDVEVAYALSAPFSAGVDTTLSTIQWCLVAVVTYPDITTRIQEELDNVVGRDRLPTFDDEGSLPYLAAFIKEVTRRLWRPAVPLAIPHATSKSDVYAGYDIPAGTTVYGNINALVKIPSLFEDPETFNPSRFLKPHSPVGGNWKGKVEGEFTIPFGFGRRVCPGIHVALQSTFISVARILWAFDIRPAADGSRVDATKTVNLGLARIPAPFYISVSVRHEHALRLIENESRDAELRLREWEF